jgi:nucleoid-associated protein YgaU
VRYVVQRGDSLWRIAAALKGDARRWPDLVAAAGSKTPTTTLRPGQELRIEVASTESEPGP